jgi:hypothetical protein
VRHRHGPQVLAANGYPDPAPIAALTRFLLEHQFDDGGWNCRLHDAHSSFNTTLLALDALAALPPAAATNAAVARGREFLLAHRLFRSHTTGAVVAVRFTRTPDPIGWQYDILRALDHLATTRAPHDERTADAIGILAKRRLPDGRWRATSPPSGARHFALTEPREPSRWVTLRCLRALRWYEPPPPDHARTGTTGTVSNRATNPPQPSRGGSGPSRASDPARATMRRLSRPPSPADAANPRASRGTVAHALAPIATRSPGTRARRARRWRGATEKAPFPGPLHVR